jgi:hypothetical protein
MWKPNNYCSAVNCYNRQVSWVVVLYIRDKYTLTLLLLHGKYGMTSSNRDKNIERCYDKSISIAKSPKLPVKVSAILLAILSLKSIADSVTSKVSAIVSLAIAIAIIDINNTDRLVT